MQSDIPLSKTHPRPAQCLNMDQSMHTVPREVTVANEWIWGGRRRGTLCP